ncbi:MAG: ParA family protein [Xanthomonadaceae bacterium]|nr:ParA family protein [Xanthomonadaceae bacterium]
MSIFSEMYFTPDEFSRIAKVEKSFISALENRGVLQTTKKRVGNVDRKMITLEGMQNYFRNLRASDSVAAATEMLMNGTGAVSAGPQIPIEAVAMATELAVKKPTLKKQMFYNVKGGTGKSTLTAQYVMRSAMMGYKILAIDLDGQGHLTVNLDVLDGHERPTIYDVLINDLPIEQAITEVAPGLDLIPANLQLCNIEIPLNSKPRREYRLGEAIEKIADQYDLIVADTNPAASILNGSMLVTADLVNVICATNPLSFHGMSLVMATIENMEREFRKKLNVKIIPNMYDAREVISQEVLGELRSQFSTWCAKSVVNRTADLNEATKRRTTVWNVSSKGTAAQDLSQMTEELLFTQPQV